MVSVVVAKCCFGHTLPVICEFAKTLETSWGQNQFKLKAKLN